MNKLFLKMITTVSFIFVFVNVTASAVIATDTSPEFSVTSVPSKYQTKDRGYFDLDLLKPGQKATLKLKIFNSSNKMSVFDVHISNGLSNSNLIMDYTDENNSNQSLFGLKLSDYVTVDKPTIILQPQSRATVTLNVKMPSKKFDGQILGGVYFKKHVTPNQKGTINSFGYVNSIILRDGDQSLQAEPKIIKARYILKSKVPTVEGTIKNDIQAYDSIMYLKQYITDSKGNVIDTNSVGGRSIAPKSQTDVYFKLEEPLKEGKYYYNFEFTTKKDRIIKSSAPFTVGNGDNMMVTANKITFTMLLFMVLMLIILFLLIFILFNRRRRKEEKNKYHNY